MYQYPGKLHTTRRCKRICQNQARPGALATTGHVYPRSRRAYNIRKPSRPSKEYTYPRRHQYYDVPEAGNRSDYYAGSHGSSDLDDYLVEDDDSEYEYIDISDEFHEPTKHRKGGKCHKRYSQTGQARW